MNKSKNDQVQTLTIHRRILLDYEDLLTNKEIKLDIPAIKYMYEKDDCTIVGVDNDFEVLETVEQMIHIIESRAVSSGVVMNG